MNGMDKTNLAKECSEDTPESRRKKGKCKLKWREKAEKRLQELREKSQ
jgi:hypothetical protein